MIGKRTQLGAHSGLRRRDGTHCDCQVVVIYASASTKSGISVLRASATTPDPQIPRLQVDKIVEQEQSGRVGRLARIKVLRSPDGDGFLPPSTGLVGAKYHESRVKAAFSDMADVLLTSAVAQRARGTGERAEWRSQ